MKKTYRGPPDHEGDLNKLNIKLGWAGGKHQKVGRNTEVNWVFPPCTNPFISYSQYN